MRDENIIIYAFQGLCGGHFTTEIGVLSSPSHTNEDTYTRDCVYIISRPNGTYVTLNTVVMDIAKTEDYLEIRDGNSEKSPLIGKFLGKTIPKTMQTTGNMLWMR